MWPIISFRPGVPFPREAYQLVGGCGEKTCLGEGVLLARPPLERWQLRLHPAFAADLYAAIARAGGGGPSQRRRAPDCPGEGRQFASPRVRLAPYPWRATTVRDDS